MQIYIDVTCMYTDFGGCGLFGFGDTATLKNGQISLSDHGHSPWSSKNSIDWNWLKKFMQICVDVTHMYTDFGGRGLSGFGDTATLKNGQIFLSDHGHSPWSSKNSIDWNWLKKFMQICVDVTHMYTDFGGRGLSGFGDTATLKNSQISLSDHGL